MIDYPNWYKLPAVKFLIRNYTYKRETMFMKPSFSESNAKTVRMIRIHNVQHLDIWTRQLYLYNTIKPRHFNLYYSLAKYKGGIPLGSLKLADRDFGNWNEECWKEIEGYDFLIDIDAGNHKEMEFAYISAKDIKKLLDECEVSYNLRFSGMGFHFLLPSIEMLKPFPEGLSFNPSDDKNVYKFYMSIAMKLHEDYSEMIDVGIYDSRRVTKIPYSLALYEHKNYVCYPFKSDDDFNNFNLSSMTPLSKYNDISSLPNHFAEYQFNINGNIFKLLEKLRMKDGKDE